MSDPSGTFVVTHSDDDSAILQDPSSGQVYALGSNPGVAEKSVIDATLSSVGLMETVYEVAELHDEWTVSIRESEEPPTKQVTETAAEQAEGELTVLERAGTGELHVITVPAELTEQAVEDVLADEEGLLARAARLGVQNVVVRSTEGVVCVRYQP